MGAVAVAVIVGISTFLIALELAPGPTLLVSSISILIVAAGSASERYLEKQFSRHHQKQHAENMRLKMQREIERINRSQVCYNDFKKHKEQELKRIIES